VIRIYGHHSGEGSFTQVTRRFIGAASALELLGGFVSIDETQENDPPGGTAKVAITLGAPSAVYMPTQIGDHKQRWLMLAPNSDQVPAAMVKWLPPYLTGLMTPSEWGAGILRRFFSLPIKVCPHGVLPHFNSSARNKWIMTTDAYVYRVLHMTSSNGERKGTRELLDAWKPFAERHPEARLLVVAPTDGLARHQSWVRKRGLDSVKVVASGALGAGARLAESMACVSLVCQPSRGEGFGLVPLEARALGVPVAATGCTGHSEHFPQATDAVELERAGCVLIETGPLSPIDDLPGAMAPSLDPAAILTALELAYANRSELKKASFRRADEVAAEWSWLKKTGPVLSELCDA
jgi:glycosyltransferase involved in cell wall biosynthesis